MRWLFYPTPSYLSESCFFDLSIGKISFCVLGKFANTLYTPNEILLMKENFTYTSSNLGQIKNVNTLVTSKIGKKYKKPSHGAAPLMRFAFRESGFFA